MKYSIKSIQSTLYNKVLHKLLLKYLIFSLSLFSSIPTFSQEIKGESSTKEAKKVDKDVVSNLTATLSPDSISVELKWTPPEEEGDIIIARSSVVIDTMEKLGISDSLGKFKNTKKDPINSFKDINLRPGEYYYAIVLVSQVKKKRVKLFPEVNYTISPTIVPNSPESPVVTPESTPEEKPEPNFVTNLHIKKVLKTVQLEWTPPIDAEKTKPKYSIYRSFDPMHKVGLMDKAIKIGEVTHPETSFTDLGLDSSQTVYYGVSVIVSDKEFLPLVDKKSFHKFYFVIDDLKAEKVNSASENGNLNQISNISAEIKKDGLHLKWTAPETASKGTTIYNIYESTSPIINSSNSTLNETAKRIGNVTHPDTTFLYPNVDRTKKVYFGITTKNAEEEENLTLKEGQSILAIEPDYSAIDNDLNPDYDKIMTHFYNKGRYQDALIKFRSLADRVSDIHIRAKSLFFTAMCHYHLRQYSEALKILLKEEVQMNYDKERVDFYVKRCLENRGRK